MIRFIYLKILWKKRNKNNYTTPVSLFDPNIVDVGKYTYGAIDILSWGSVGEKLVIGSFVSIADNVRFILGGNHHPEFFSTYPFKTKVIASTKVESFSKGPIIIEDDVWIGYGSTILSGVTVSRGAIIAANSVVTRDIPPYAFVAGVPARVKKFRFDDETIGKLLLVDFEKIGEQFIRENEELLYSNDINKIDILIDKLKRI